MGEKFTEDETKEMKLIRPKWEKTTDVLSVEGIEAGKGGDFGKTVDGVILVRRGKASLELAKDLQEKAFTHVPDMASFSIRMTDADQKTIEYVWYVGQKWEERVYPMPTLPSQRAPKDEY